MSGLFLIIKNYLKKSRAIFLCAPLTHNSAAAENESFVGEWTAGTRQAPESRAKTSFWHETR
jgi:hypothetical protein